MIKKFKVGDLVTNAYGEFFISEVHYHEPTPQNPSGKKRDWVKYIDAGWDYMSSITKLNKVGRPKKIKFDVKPLLSPIKSKDKDSDYELVGAAIEEVVKVFANYKVNGLITRFGVFYTKTGEFIGKKREW